MKTLAPAAVLAAAFLFTVPVLDAQVPNLVNYQGRVAVGTMNFDGAGQFKFALVNGAGTTTYWSNDGTSTAGSEPAAAVPLTVSKGLYSVLLGDATLANMTLVPATVFTNADVRLRVWFDDGVNGSQLLTPDQRLAPQGYLANGSVSATALSDGAVTSAKIATGAVTGTQLASGLTLGGTTSGTFSGSLSGNASTAGTATNFSGSLAGDVTGPQGATVVQSVGGVSAANVASGANLANAATTANTASAIVRRDATGSFAADSLALLGNLTLAASTSSTGIIYFGADRMLHAKGTGNFFAGPAAGNLTMSGTLNTGSGADALLSNTSGTRNTADGYRALRANTNGADNTASGWQALTLIAGGSGNTAFGSSAGAKLLSGSRNVFIGGGAGTEFTTGSDNTFIGNNVADDFTSGSNNIFIGALAADQLTNGNNNIYIGEQDAGTSESNTIRIGYPLIHSNTFLCGSVHVGQQVGPSTLSTFDVNGGLFGNITAAIRQHSTARHFVVSVRKTNNDGLLDITNPADSGTNTLILYTGNAAKPGGGTWADSSDRRLKKNIASMSGALEKLLRLRGVTFGWVHPEAHDGHAQPQGGFIAQEVAEVFPAWVTKVKAHGPDAALVGDDQVRTLSLPFEFNALVVEAIKEQQRQIETLRTENAALKQQLAGQAARDNALEARLSRLEQREPAAEPVKLSRKN